jgi:hypothetical protein
MRARADFAKPNIIAFNEQFYAKKPQATQRGAYFKRDCLCAGKRFLTHGLRLPAFAVIAMLLAMADGCAKMGVNLALGIAGADSK